MDILLEETKAKLAECKDAKQLKDLYTSFSSKASALGASATNFASLFTSRKNELGI